MVVATATRLVGRAKLLDGLATLTVQSLMPATAPIGSGVRFGLR